MPRPPYYCTFERKKANRRDKVETGTMIVPERGNDADSAETNLICGSDRWVPPDISSFPSRNRLPVSVKNTSSIPTVGSS